MVCRALSTIAETLRISEHDAVVLYATTRIGLAKIGLIRAMAILGRLVETYALSDSEFEPAYAVQLAQKGLLTQEEGLFLAGEGPPPDYGNALGGPGAVSDSTEPEVLPRTRVHRKRRTRGGKGRKASHPGRSAQQRNQGRRELVGRPAKGRPAATVAVRRVSDDNVDQKPEA